MMSADAINQQSEQVMEDDDISLIDSSTNPRWRLACGLILLALLLERFVFFSIVTNIFYALSIDPFGWMPSNALFVVYLLLGAAYLTPLFAGILADTCLGKFRVIVIGYVLQLSIVVLPLMFRNTSKTRFDNQPCANLSDPRIWQECGAPAILSSLVVMGLGSGCVLAVMAPFGAQQIGPGEPKRLRWYFLFFFWMNCLGAGIAVTVFAYFQQIDLSDSYLALFITLVISFSLFVFGKLFYVDDCSENNQLRDIFGVVRNAISNKFSSSCLRSNHDRFYNSADDIDGQNEDNENLMEVRVSISDDVENADFFDRAKMRFGGQYRESVTEKVKVFFRVLFILFSVLVFWTIYFQMLTTFLLQGIHMNVAFFKISKVPPAWLLMFNMVAVVLTVPILGLLMQKIIRHFDHQAAFRIRIMLGLLFGVLSMVSAGIVEHYRLADFWGNGTTVPQNAKRQWDDTNSSFLVSQMSIFYQIPQYMLMGCAEIFVMVTFLEFIFQQSPAEYVSLLNGCYWLTMALGGLFGGGIIEVCTGYVFFPEHGLGSVNHRLCDYEGCESLLAVYFFSLAGLQVVGMFIFLLVLHLAMPRPPRIIHDDPKEDVVVTTHYDSRSVEPPVIG